MGSVILYNCSFPVFTRDWDLQPSLRWLPVTASLLLRVRSSLIPKPCIRVILTCVEIAPLWGCCRFWTHFKNIQMNNKNIAYFCNDLFVVQLSYLPVHLWVSYTFENSQNKKICKGALNSQRHRAKIFWKLNILAGTACRCAEKQFQQSPQCYLS